MSATPLPAYTVRVSDRARHVRLTVTPREGLVIVVPRGWRGDAAAIVASKRAWAERSLAQVETRLAAHRAGPDALLPHAVDLRLTGERLPVRYEVTEHVRARVARDAHAIRVSGPGDAGIRLDAMSRWLDREAWALLPQRVLVLAERHGLVPARIRVTRARSRWGSCSARGTVSLSRNLVFLEPHLADALILHELAHLSHLDHSARFHALLAALDPDAAQHRKDLRRAAASIPAWAEA